MAQVVEVDPQDRSRIRAFVDFPYRLYADAPGWAPDGLRADQRRQLDPGRHPFHRHSAAAFFIAERQGRVVGRISAIDNRLFNEYQGTATGFFGHFEAIDDPSVVTDLVATAKGWSTDRGLTSMTGPRGLLGFDGSVMVEGFDTTPVLGVPYNGPYYDAHLRAAGFEPEEDFVTGYILESVSIPDAIYAIADKVAEKGSYVIKRFTSRRELAEWVPAIKEAYLTSVAELDSFYPPTDEDIDDLIGTVLRIANPKGISLVLHEGAVVGFLFSYPNLAPALRSANGRLLPFGWYHLLRARADEKWYCVNGLGLLPAHRGRGANAMLYATLARTATELGWAGGHILQVAAGNAASIKDMEKLATVWTARHRRYRMDLA
ncbi:MAG: GNAT family N-acetyltransferase [Acidimicrobiia bacterium]|nr:MAG: GNAT family N-acetyltransferase [Acidimicrobiia bacterium]